MEQIVGEVHVVVRERAAHVIILAAALFHQTLEVGHDGVVAALARVVLAEVIVHILAAVKRKHHVAHLFVEPIDQLIVHDHAVGGEGEAEVFVIVLLDAARVLDQLLDHVKVERRLAAEEVYLQVAARAGILDQEVECLLADLKAHQCALAVILALACEAIGAVEVAGVCHVQAECLDDLGVVFVVDGKAFIHVGRVKLARLFQCLHVLDALQQLLARHVGLVRVLLQKRLDDLLCGVGLIHFDDVVRDLVHRVHRAGAGVQHDVVSVQFVLMYHKLPHKEKRRFRRKAAFYPNYLLLSQLWLITPQEVLQADWQEVWHSPQPPVFTVF